MTERPPPTDHSRTILATTGGLLNELLGIFAKVFFGAVVIVMILVIIGHTWPYLLGAAVLLIPTFLVRGPSQRTLARRQQYLAEFLAQRRQLNPPSW